MIENRIDCYKCLKTSDCFKSLKKEDFDRIRSTKLELNFRKDEIICKQGTFASYILYLHSGSAKTYLESADGKKNIISVLPQGKMIGLSSLFASRIYPFSAAAIEDCKICSFDRRLIEELVIANGEFASSLIKCLNDSTMNHYNRYIFNSQRSLKGRLADILVHLSEDIYGSDEFKLSLSRNDLAEWTQMAPESVTRILSNLKKEKLIKVHNKMIRINDLQKLKIMSEAG